MKCQITINIDEGSGEVDSMELPEAITGENSLWVADVMKDVRDYAEQYRKKYFVRSFLESDEEAEKKKIADAKAKEAE